jgi:hypothetical protein
MAALRPLTQPPSRRSNSPLRLILALGVSHYDSPFDSGFAPLKLEVIPERAATFGPLGTPPERMTGGEIHETIPAVPVFDVPVAPSLVDLLVVVTATKANLLAIPLVSLLDLVGIFGNVGLVFVVRRCRLRCRDVHAVAPGVGSDAPAVVRTSLRASSFFPSPAGAGHRHDPHDTGERAEEDNEVQTHRDQRNEPAARRAGHDRAHADHEADQERGPRPEGPGQQPEIENGGERRNDEHR